MLNFDPIRTIIRSLPERLALSIVARLPNILGNRYVYAPYRGAQIYLYTGESVGRRIYFRNDFEEEQIGAFLDLLDGASVMFDVGANIGVYALASGKRGVRVIAFEPDSEIRSMLERGIAANAGINVAVVPEAVSSIKGTADFFSHRRGNFGVGSLVSGEGKKISVPTNTLDAYVEQYGLPDIVKMDIEGAEWLAIKGAKNTLERQDAPVFFVEIHPSSIEELGGTVQDFISTFRKNGFSVYGIKKHTLGPIKNHEWLVFSKKNIALPDLAELPNT